MAKDISSIEINAHAEKVWAFLTKPELIKLWQYGSEIDTDWKTGSSIRFKSEWKNKTYEQWGTIIDIEPYNLIKYTLFAPSAGVEDKPENYFTMTYLLSESKAVTTLKIIKEDNRPQVNSDDKSEEDSVLTNLKSLVEQ